MKRRSFSALVTLLACLGLASSTALAAGAGRKAFGKHSPFRAEELPEGKLKAGLQALDPQSKEKAMQWLHTFDFDQTDASQHLRVDNGGGVFIVCPDTEGKCDGHSHGAADPATDPIPSDETENVEPTTQATSETPLVASAAVAVSSPPAYHSKPNATRRIYLDFNGGIVTGTAWNNNASYGSVASWDVKVWTQDTDATTFNDAEQAWMKKVWQRVAEDYAPFDVDVTTDVAYDPDNYTGNKDNVGWLLICDTFDKNNVALPHNGSGGVAYVGVFGDSTYSPTYQPAWVSSTNGGGSESVIAEAASHEMGHNMGLSHDSTTTSTTGYYGGHGSGDVSWGTIMGAAYNKNVTQWSKGEYYDANQLQDDLSTISGKVPYRSDDHGNSLGTATALTITGGNTIASTTPENDPSNASPANKGVIERNTDVDVFSFYTGTGSIQLNANPWIQPSGTRGGNLDIVLELYNAAGTLIASNNGASVTTASITASVTQGYHYLHVRNTGTGTPLVSPPSGYTVYGSIGQYFLSGTIVNAVPPPVLTGITPTSGFTDTIVNVDLSGTGLSASTAVKLTRSGQSDVAASSVALVGSVLRCQFDLAGAETGAWNVVATNPNLTTSTLAGAFTVVAAIWTESFDGTVTDWTSQATTGTNTWSLSTAQSQSPSTSYFAAGPSSKTTTNLTSPNVPVPAGATDLQLKFWHSYNLQNARDAGKLEFSINDGAWFDVTSSGSGAAFATNGYTTTIGGNGPASNRNEFSGQFLWSGNSGGFIETVVNLTDTAKYAGNNLRMRWRIATDSSTSSTGWYVDSVALIGSGVLNNQPPVITAAASSTSTETQTDPDTTVYQIIRGATASLSVSASDDAGESALTYTWSGVSGPAPVAFSSNGANASKNTTATFQSAGDYQISCLVLDGQGLSVSSPVNLRVVQTASGLTVSPASATVVVGATRQFGAVLLDQFNTAMASQPPSFAWSVAGGGSISGSGLFTATTAGGPHPVTATSAAISNTASVSVTPAPATVTLGALSQTYDGSARTVTATTNPPGLALSITYNGSSTPPSDAGSYAVAATITDPNYQGSTTGTLVIEKATATITLGGLSQIYDGAPKPVTATTTPGGLTVGVTYGGSATVPVNAGSYAVVATISSANHQGSTTGTLVIEKAAATLALGGLSQTYDGSPKPVTATTTPGGLSVDVTYDGSTAVPLNAGSYAVVATITSPNHQGSTAGTLIIGKATAALELGGLSQTYDGSPKSVSTVTTPAGLTVDVTYNGSTTAPMTAGSYAVVATISSTNHQGSTSGTLIIGKAAATVTLGGLLQTYDGSPKPITATTTPGGLTVDILYDGSASAPVNAGTFPVSATITDPNYQGTAAGSLVIGKAVAGITLGSLSQTYDGSPKPVTAATTPEGLAVALTYDGSSMAPTNAGSYPVSASITDPNYQGASSGTLVIAKATATITLSGLSQTYDGLPKPVSAATSPAGLAVEITYDGLPAAPVDAGSYAVSAVVVDANHQGVSSDTLVINPAEGWTSWTEEQFTPSEAAAGLAVENADPDGDGLVNLAEYALGSDPNEFTVPPSAVKDGNGLTLTFNRPANLPDVSYAAEVSDGLGTWTPIPLEIIQTGDPETVRARDPLTSGDPSKRFIRLKFTRD